LIQLSLVSPIQSNKKGRIKRPFSYRRLLIEQRLRTQRQQLEPLRLAQLQQKKQQLRKLEQLAQLEQQRELQMLELELELALERLLFWNKRSTGRRLK
jgi:hypothetical protein